MGWQGSLGSDSSVRNVFNTAYTPIHSEKVSEDSGSLFGKMPRTATKHLSNWYSVHVRVHCFHPDSSILQEKHELSVLSSRYCQAVKQNLRLSGYKLTKPEYDRSLKVSGFFVARANTSILRSTSVGVCAEAKIVGKYWTCSSLPKNATPTNCKRNSSLKVTLDIVFSV